MSEIAGVQHSPRARLTLGSVYGLVGVLIAAAVHASTFTSAPLPPEHPLFWIMHVGIFPLFGAMVWRLRAWSEQAKGPLGIPTTRLRWQELLSYLPAYAIALGGLLFAYAMVNFLLAMSHLPSGHGGGGSVGAGDGRYVVRAFSGHWLIFYTLPMLFFLFVPSSARPDDSRRAAA